MKERNIFKMGALFHITKVLWHLDIFRRSFRELSGHVCTGDSCIFCALKDLFGQLQLSHDRPLPPDALRKALTQSFSNQHRIQIACMNDVAQCFESILLRMHFHIAHREAEDTCNASHCIPHQKFGMTLVEQSVCGVCDATSEPLPFTQMVHYVSASALISQSSQLIGVSSPDLFSRLLKKAGRMGHIRHCPSSCGANIRIRRTLMNWPEIVSVGIVWDSQRPSLEHIVSLLNTLRNQLRLSDVFHGSFGSHNGQNIYHQLVGVITYHAPNYSTFFYHTKLKVWVYLDDENVREVGPHWEHVVETCRRGRNQPLLLLFAVPEGTPINGSTASKQVILLDQTQNDFGMPNQGSLTPGPQKSAINGNLTRRKAITANAEQCPNQKQMLPKNDYKNLVEYRDTIFEHVNCETRSIDRNDGVQKYQHFMRHQLVRRDSGNWSGDRNSASSSSSTSLENPYHYILGKDGQNLTKNADLSSGSGNSSGGGLADAGYDSFSISSTDSYPIRQNVEHDFQLAQIPEGINTPPTSRHTCDENTCVAEDGERLFSEIDQLLKRSEGAEDLITALSLCNAAVNKARAAMNAPYSNPQAASLATMKYNVCILRARTLHRKLEEPLYNNLKYGEARHNQERSNSSTQDRIHCHQNSKNKEIHQFWQTSMEVPDTMANSNSSPKKISNSKAPHEKVIANTNVQLYSTLPKNKKSFLFQSAPKPMHFSEDEEFMLVQRPGRSRSRIEKRAKSEEGRSKSKEAKVETSSQKKQHSKDPGKLEHKHEGKKQHKIRRKLLMGGLTQLKNCSMPDLRDNETKVLDPFKLGHAKATLKDDSIVAFKTTINPNLSGYLSEGNLEYSSNPNLQRSKLMRKSFHSSRILQCNKVPPPPPLRITSQLSKTNYNSQPCTRSDSTYSNCSSSWTKEPTTLPFIPPKLPEPKLEAVIYSNSSFLKNMVTTKALVHKEASYQPLLPLDLTDLKQITIDKVEDFQLPPYPSPIHSNIHSRQASEDLPPPPVVTAPEFDSSFVAMLKKSEEEVEKKSLNSNWLKELQIEQAIRGKLNPLSIETSQQQGLVDEVDNASVKSSTNLRKSSLIGNCNDVDGRHKNSKKKNVTFCEDVVLVATAEDQQSDGYIPNPILERVLRSVLDKNINKKEKGQAKHSVVPLKQTDSGGLAQVQLLTPKQSEIETGHWPVSSTRTEEYSHQINAPNASIHSTNTCTIPNSKSVNYVSHSARNNISNSYIETCPTTSHSNQRVKHNLLNHPIQKGDPGTYQVSNNFSQGTSYTKANFRNSTTQSETYNAMGYIGGVYPTFNNTNHGFNHTPVNVIHSDVQVPAYHSHYPNDITVISRYATSSPKSHTPYTSSNAFQNKIQHSPFTIQDHTTQTHPPYHQAEFPTHQPSSLPFYPSSSKSNPKFPNTDQNHCRNLVRQTSHASYYNQQLPQQQDLLPLGSKSQESQGIQHIPNVSVCQQAPAVSSSDSYHYKSSRKVIQLTHPVPTHKYSYNSISKPTQSFYTLSSNTTHSQFLSNSLPNSETTTEVNAENSLCPNYQSSPHQIINFNVNQHYCPQNGSNSTTVIVPRPSPYQSLPPNSAAYELYMPETSQQNTISHQPTSKFLNPRCSHPPPIYQHPPSPSTTLKGSAFQQMPTPNQVQNIQVKYPNYQHGYL